jgi:putative intracellular protease/amidase
MTNERRSFLQVLAAGAGLAALTRAGAMEPAMTDHPAHDMSMFPAKWSGNEQIAMLLYPGFTALDLVGPHFMLTGLIGAKVHLVGKTREPVVSDTGLGIVPTLTMGRCPKNLDIVFTPGGSEGTLKAMRDNAYVDWLADRGWRAGLVASVCTGSLLLGQAGLLRGKRATSHWVARDLLPQFGAIPVNERVVWDGNVVTGAGVSAGLDLGIAVVARLRDAEYAQTMQLLAEYAPQLQFQSGTPESATPQVSERTARMFDGLREQLLLTSKQARGAG